VKLSDLVVAVVLAALAAVPLALSLWALLDAARHPQWAWALAGRRQVVWMAAIMLGTFTVVGGMLLCAYYLSKVRHEIAAAEDGRI
jgi:hypothetical protein